MYPEPIPSAVKGYTDQRLLDRADDYLFVRLDTDKS